MFNRMMCWVVTAEAVVGTPATLWFAVTRDWTVSPVAVLVASGAVVYRLALRKLYGVRHVPAVKSPPPLAEQIAAAVEAVRARQWAAVMEQAYRARPPAVQPVPPVLASAGTSFADFGLGMERLSAAVGPCAHAAAEPVDLLLTGETVAWLCLGCGRQLPAGWKPRA